MRIFPEMCPRMTCPFSSLTRKVALGRVSMISPCIWITSSFAMFVTVVFPSKRGISKRRAPFVLALITGSSGFPSFEPPFFEQALVLVRHDVGLHLRHEVHRHHDDDEKRGAAEVERYIPPQDQEFRQQANQGYVDGAGIPDPAVERSEEHTSELQSRLHLVCRLLLEK